GLLGSNAREHSKYAPFLNALPTQPCVLLARQMETSPKFDPVPIPLSVRTEPATLMFDVGMADPLKGSRMYQLNPVVPEFAMSIVLIDVKSSLNARLVYPTAAACDGGVRPGEGEGDGDGLGDG